MIPGAKSAEGVLYITTASPATTDPRLGGVALTSSGQLYVTQSPPTSFQNGLGMVGDSVAIGVGVAADFKDGLPRLATGGLQVQIDVVPLPTDPYVGEIRVGANGVYVTSASVPGRHAFSNGFSGGFDAP